MSLKYTENCKNEQNNKIKTTKYFKNRSVHWFPRSWKYQGILKLPGKVMEINNISKSS